MDQRKNKKLMYIANIRLPTEKAHGLQIMKTCEAIALQGIEVELLVPRRANHLKGDPFDFYQVKKNFKVTRLFCLDLVNIPFFGKVGFWIESWTFYRSIRKYLSALPADIYYTRDFSLAFWLSKIFKPFFYEIHTLPEKAPTRYIETWNRASGLIVISNGLKSGLVERGVLPEKIAVAPDAVDIKKFTVMQKTKFEVRRELGLPQEKKIVMYTGHLYEWKGARILAEAAQVLHDDTIEVYFVGGTPEDIISFSKKYGNAKNIHIIGWKEHSMIPLWLEAADVLVIPTSGKTAIGALYTSPMKLFEYMSINRPMIAADIPSLREVLDERLATFFIADDPHSLAEKIYEVFSKYNEAEKKAAYAREEVSRYSWENRARLIRDFIK